LVEDYPNTPIEVTDVSFKDALAKYPRILVDCWAAWCGPCKMVSPIIDELAKDYAGKIVFGKLDVDNNSGTATEFGIMSIPTLLIAKDGKVIDRIIGAVPRQEIESKLKASGLI